ncbi:MAG TPA: hypothetical protein VHC39_04650 [Rhizomicrobium sp.]|nr:hypothetical protein [Rhizomicrobium sp.]
MTINMRKFALAMTVTSTMSLGALAAMTAPAAAYVVCDWDGDDCYNTHPNYWDRDREWREHRAWEARREWEEERDDDYRRWYWRHHYYGGWDRPGGTSLWFNF